MNNIIGPISHDDWYLMRMLRESIGHMSSIDRQKYKIAIDVHRNTYRSILKEVVDSSSKIYLRDS